MAAPVAPRFGPLLTVLPNLLVLGLLATIGVVGQFTEWKPDRIAGLFRSTGQRSENTSPAEKDKGPAITPIPLRSTTPSTDWCEQHGLPESQCTVCHPEFAVRPPLGNEPTNQPTGENGPNPRTCQTHLQKINFESNEAIKKSGIQTAPVEKRALSLSVSANGSIDYNQNKLAHLSSRQPGTVWKVYKEVGQPVRKGDLLGVIDAGEVGKAKAEFLQAVRLYELRQQNFAQMKNVPGAVADRQLREAETGVAETRIRRFMAQQALVNLGLPIRAEDVTDLTEEQLARRLRFLGLPDAVTAGLDPISTTANLLPLVAPFDGTVVGRDMVEGEVVSPSQSPQTPQFTIADLRRLSVLLDVRQEDAAGLAVGQKLTFRPDATTAVEATGTVDWISTEVDEKTRTVRVRSYVDNSAGQLRVRSFGTGRILISEKPAAVAVSNESLQWDGCCHLVFVRGSDGLTFHPRKVKLGLRARDYTEITAGVLPGEIVATVGSHVLKSEIFKSLIGSDE